MKHDEKKIEELLKGFKSDCFLELMKGSLKQYAEHMIQQRDTQILDFLVKSQKEETAYMVKQFPKTLEKKTHPVWQNYYGRRDMAGYIANLIQKEDENI